MQAVQIHAGAIGLFAGIDVVHYYQSIRRHVLYKFQLFSALPIPIKFPFLELPLGSC